MKKRSGVVTTDFYGTRSVDFREAVRRQIKSGQFEEFWKVKHQAIKKRAT